MLFKQKSEKAHEKRRHGPIRILAFAAIVITVVFVGYTIISDNIKIRENKERLKELTEQTDTMKARNEQLTGFLNDPEKFKEYIEKEARDKLDFANGDEIIFHVIPSGN